MLFCIQNVLTLHVYKSLAFDSLPPIVDNGKIATGDGEIVPFHFNAKFGQTVSYRPSTESSARQTGTQVKHTSHCVALKLSEADMDM